jgi:hypothetical protein
MVLDAKWLELLKAAGGKTTSVAVACGLFLLVAHRAGYPRWMPGCCNWLRSSSCSPERSPSRASRALQTTSFARARGSCTGGISAENQRGLHKYIPHMTEREREVISYLLAKNQKTFEAAADGGRVATLLSRGIVMIVARPNQHLDMDNVPMTIPDHLWDVLLKHKDQFPYTPPPDDEVEPHPWRRHWME